MCLCSVWAKQVGDSVRVSAKTRNDIRSSILWTTGGSRRFHKSVAGEICGKDVRKNVVFCPLREKGLGTIGCVVPKVREEDAYGTPKHCKNNGWMFDCGWFGTVPGGVKHAVIIEEGRGAGALACCQ
ncbi:hypothetical protein TRVL_05804 [Trypanosoma vivax]|nr:hypothetical protein TRVL_05804 [Trypanosoma vivax]